MIGRIFTILINPCNVLHQQHCLSNFVNVRSLVVELSHHDNIHVNQAKDQMYKPRSIPKKYVVVEHN